MVYRRKRRAYKKKTQKRYRKKVRGPKKRLPRAQLRPELKYSGASYSSVGADYTGTGLYLLNGIDQGTTNQTRVGNNLKIKSIYLRLTLSTDVTTTYYIYLVYDKQPNKAAFTINNFIDAIGGNYLPWSQRNNEYKDRFVTLKKWMIDMNPNRASATIQRTFEKFVNIWKGVPCIYSGSGSTVGSITLGSIYLVIGTSSSTGPTFSGTHRVKFTDD